MPVHIFAKKFKLWRHQPTETLPAFVDGMKSNVPTVYDEILKVTTLLGFEAAEQIRKAVAITFSRFGGEVNCAFIYAVMIYIWSSSDSDRMTIITNLLTQYLAAKSNALPKLMQACSDSYAVTVTSNTMMYQCAETDMTKTHGYRRLNWRSNVDFFASHWLFLFECATELLVQTPEAPTVAHALMYINSSHFEKQQEGETMQDFFARLQLAYGKSLFILKRMKAKEQMPHPNTLVKLVMEKADRKYSLKVRQVLEHHLDICEAELSFDTCITLYMKAAKCKNRTFVEFDTILDDTDPRKAAKKAQDKPQRDKPQQDKQQPQQDTGTPPAQDNATNPKREPKPRIDDSKYPPNPNPHSTYIQRRQWKQAGLCDNCGTEGHTQDVCPYKHWCGCAWFAPHVPIQLPANQPAPKPNLPSRPDKHTRFEGQPQQTATINAILAPALDDPDEPTEPERPILQMQAPQGGGEANESPLTIAPETMVPTQPIPDTLTIIVYMMLALTTLAWQHSLLMALPVLMVAVPISVAVSTALTTISTTVMTTIYCTLKSTTVDSAYIWKRILPLTILLACVTLPALASVDSHHLDHKRTEFVVIAQSVKQPTTSRVAGFNGFTGSTLDNKTRLTIGPDLFADVSIIAEDAVDPT